MSGIVTLQAGEDAMPWRQTSLGRDLYWMRVLWSAGEFGCMPEMTRLLLNTVMATQTVDLAERAAGIEQRKTTPDVSHRARAGFARSAPGGSRTGHARRRGIDAIREAEGDDAVTTIADAQGRVEQVWVRWHEVEDWLSSTHERPAFRGGSGDGRDHIWRR